MRILAVETSCDETAAAVVSRHADDSFVTVERSVIASSALLHQKYGGVYPEVASREHSRAILPVIAEALDLSAKDTSRLPKAVFRDIDGLVVTQGPGLIGSLLVGTQTMATLSMVTKLPLYAVNHLSGHIYASFIRHNEEDASPPSFPLLAFIVSGGHTMLLVMEDHHTYRLLGQTRDDAAGEAFDKVAKLLDLGYPGGPQISALAQKGSREAYRLPIGLEHEDTFDFSFSGLKTAVLRLVQENTPLTARQKADIAASFERVVVDALLLKLYRALDRYPVCDIVLGGGVAANTYLRDRLAALLRHRAMPPRLHVPPLEFCTDNAAVIGAAALFGNLESVDPAQLETCARLPLVSSYHERYGKL